MKVVVGYYDRDGRPLGMKLDSVRRKKYFIAIGTLRKKIAEHDGQTPYKNKKPVSPYTRTYCDQNRLFVDLDVYENGKKVKTYTHLPYHGRGETPFETMDRICEHIRTNWQAITRRVHALTFIYLPNGNQVDLEHERAHRR